MAKYLDQTGLTYLWGKIKENFTNEIEIVKVNGTALTIDSADKSVNVVIPAATVTGVKSGDKVLSLDGTELKSTLDLVYDSSAKTIYLNGNDGQEIAHIDATDFIKDGMLDNVVLSGSNLIFTFNTESGKEVVSVDLSKFIDVYTAGNGIDIDGQEVSVKLADEQGNAVLSFDDAGGLKAEVDLSAYALADDVESALSAEATARAEAIAAVESALSAEATARAEAIAAVESAVSVEAAARAAAITDVESAVSVEAAARAEAITAVESAISVEAAARAAAITDVESAISAEENARKQAISALSSAFDEALDELESAYTAADAALGVRIDAAESAVTVEAAARAAAITAVESAYTHADAALDGRLDLLEGSASTWNNAGGFAVKAEGAEVAGYDHNQSAETFVDLVAGENMEITVSGGTIEFACTIDALTTADIDAAISGATA